MGWQVARIDEYWSPQQWDSDFFTQVLPAVESRVAELDERSAELLEAFFRAYKASVTHRCSRKVRRYITSRPVDNGLGYGSEETAPAVGRDTRTRVVVGPNESVRSFAGRWLDTLVTTEWIDGFIVHTRTLEEFEQLRAIRHT